MAILPGLVRYDEAFGTEPIRHAFRVTVQSTNGYVFPASHRAGSTAGALPMGARLRLKASVNLSGFTPAVQRVLQAMKTYGLIVADNGSNMFITGTSDPRWEAPFDDDSFLTGLPEHPRRPVRGRPARLDAAGRRRRRRRRPAEQLGDDVRPRSRPARPASTARRAIPTATASATPPSAPPARTRAASSSACSPKASRTRSSPRGSPR